MKAPFPTFDLAFQFYEIDYGFGLNAEAKIGNAVHSKY